MQFVDGGPDVPDNLIHAHEKGDVVFFCGAGISVPAGLPLFKELALKLFTAADIKQPELEDPERALLTLQEAINDDEQRRRATLIEFLWDALNIQNEVTPENHYHKSLVTLSTNAKGTTKLVTTNFDRIFEQFLDSRKTRPEALIAPRLPVPKPDKWNGIVYLHGLLHQQRGYVDKNRQFVLTSADFGQAYLNERWAARFVSELFRNYSVCFIGYGLNDFVMRYLTIAIADDERVMANLPDRYAFVTNEESQRWQEHGIEPIPYSQPNGESDHKLLMDTLSQWATQHERGEKYIIDIVESIAPLDVLHLKD